jgi:energy-coupling factor transport system ATP-binding protein
VGNIKIENLNYSYPDIASPSLKNINIEIPQGQFVLIVGNSGSGKSTLIRSIAGLVPNFYGGTYQGNVYFDDQEIRKLNRREMIQKVGMVFQDPESQMVMTNVEQELAFGLENLELSNELMKRRIMEVTSALSLNEYRDHFIPELSGGQKQKIALASVLSMQPDILLLDEPTSQLDPIAGEEILTMVRRLNEENGITIVLTEQKLERCFHFADRIIIMDQGEIIKDSCDVSSIANWIVENNMSFIPPVSKVFANIGFQNVPVTVKQGRDMIRKHVIEKTDFKSRAIKSTLDQSAYEKEIKSHEIKENRPNSRGSDQYLLDVNKLWFTYPNGKEILKNVHLQIKEGSFSVIMGENGGGKTTLLKNINGLLRPSRGHVKLSGRDIKGLKVEEIAISVGYLSQNPNDYLFLPTVREEIEFTMKNLSLFDEGIIDEILTKLQIDQFKDMNPRDLSTGERQRVALASVLVTKPKLLLLDEPTRGLDYQLKEALGEILLSLVKEGTTILMIAHDVEFAAEYADDIVLFNDGSVIGSGCKFEMLTDSTFYSPQMSRLFNDFEERIVTIAQGEKALKERIQRQSKNEVLRRVE